MKELALSVAGTPIATPEGLRGLGAVGLNNILSTAVTWLFVFAIVLTLFFLIYGGIRWIVSGGNKEKLAQARQTLTYAIIGLIVVLLSYFIVNVIFGLFGLKFVSP